jgi:hypothetical protein
MKKLVQFRCDENLYNFLHTFANINNQKISDVCRDVLNYFSYRLLLGDIRNKSYKKIREEFLHNIKYNGNTWGRIVKPQKNDTKMRQK